MKYIIKENIDLTIDKIINENVEIKNNILIISQDGSIVTFQNGQWFINNVFQGDGALWIYETDKDERLKTVFEVLNE